MTDKQEQVAVVHRGSRHPYVIPIGSRDEVADWIASRVQVSSDNVEFDGYGPVIFTVLSQDEVADLLPLLAEREPGAMKTAKRERVKREREAAAEAKRLAEEAAAQAAAEKRAADIAAVIERKRVEAKLAAWQKLEADAAAEVDGQVVDTTEVA